MGQPARPAIEGERFRLLVEGMPGCGLTHDNRVVCWYPFTTDATADFDLAFVKIVGTHSMWRPLWDPMVCGLGAHGETYCWGTNTHGQMGVGETIAQGRPTGVRPPPPPAR